MKLRPWYAFMLGMVIGGAALLGVASADNKPAVIRVANPGVGSGNRPAVGRRSLAMRAG
jgi:hypothetical protein